MNPINSKYDIRLTTLLGLAINVIESLALETNTDPEQILAEHLYITTKRLHEIGEEIYMDKLTRNYPMLEEAIDW